MEKSTFMMGLTICAITACFSRSRFTGKERDTESGNDYFGARYYSSAMGRFMSVDPIAVTVRRLLNPQELNLYAYSANNPLKFIDPDGENLFFANLSSENAFWDYYMKLDEKSDEFKTAQRLITSDIDYEIKVGGGSYSEKEEGKTLPNGDGSRIVMSVKNEGNGHETFSLKGRLAHELEHGRQFDNGEISFLKTSKGEWTASPTSYDIFDEVNAFKAQLNVAPEDGNKGGLTGFADAKSDDERAGILIRISDNYDHANKTATNNVYPGRKPGELVKTDQGMGVNH